MATPKNSKAAKSKTSATKVTRIKADEKSTPKKVTKQSAKAPVLKPETAKKKRKNPLKSFGGYFVGAWRELREVRWPTRRATWGMTMALLGFVAFFVALILLLDALFQSIFQTLVS